MQSIYADVLEKHLKVPDALFQVKRVFRNMSWCISGLLDLSQMNKVMLCQLVSVRIKDHRFIRLLHQLLKNMSITGGQHKINELLFAVCVNELRSQLKRRTEMDGKIEVVCCQNNFLAGIAGSKKRCFLCRWHFKANNAAKSWNANKG
ncbi:hypothetical protein RWE15_24480 [Virgibacillus halophilus]|uniref:Uncharacterized protein n=1 Tax=Tigheibacillus halophilus TaxID=361280 RepID=A0ABU5CC10_9BACI|nr:hypothetical protein [Virgibacillus halophilus]